MPARLSGQSFTSGQRRVQRRARLYPALRNGFDFARSIDPDFDAVERVKDLSFSEELHAIDAVIGRQGVAIVSDVIVSNELRGAGCW